MFGEKRSWDISSRVCGLLSCAADPLLLGQPKVDVERNRRDIIWLRCGLREKGFPCWDEVAVIIQMTEKPIVLGLTCLSRAAGKS